MDFLLDLLKRPLDSLCARVDLRGLLVEEPLIWLYLGVAVLDLGRDVVCHGGGQEHLELRERYFASVEAKDLQSDQPALGVVLELGVDLVYEGQASPLVH